MVENETSAAEQEGRDILESGIFAEFPDIEMRWKYHPIRKEHSCCFSKGKKDRTIFFPCETLRGICEEPDRAEALIQETLSEIRRRVL
jgi:hypothetical protein